MTLKQKLLQKAAELPDPQAHRWPAFRACEDGTQAGCILQALAREERREWVFGWGLNIRNEVSRAYDARDPVALRKAIKALPDDVTWGNEG